MLIQPMAGRSEEDIKRERKMITESIEQNGGEVINTLFTEEAPKEAKQGLYYLGKSIQAMAEADSVLLLPNWRDARGCRIEAECASAYGLEVVEMKLTRGDEADDKQRMAYGTNAKHE